MTDKEVYYCSTTAYGIFFWNGWRYVCITPNGYIV